MGSSTPTHPRTPRGVGLARACRELDEPPVREKSGYLRPSLALRALFFRLHLAVQEYTQLDPASQPFSSSCSSFFTFLLSRQHLETRCLTVAARLISCGCGYDSIHRHRSSTIIPRAP
eukprot:scaffold133834_cov32-Tisochrysis_lutea.AAC.5